MGLKQKERSKATIDIDGPNGNAFYLLGAAKNLCRQFQYTQADEDAITSAMKSGDYAHLLGVFDYFFGYVVDLETDQPDRYEIPTREIRQELDQFWVRDSLDKARKIRINRQKTA